MPIGIMLVDDDPLVRTGLKIILDMDEELKVIEACQNGDEAYRKVLSNPGISVILMDIRMPVCDGVLATRKILEIRPDVKIIILTTFDDDEYVFEAIKAGAKGYLLKSISPDKMAEAVKVVHQGNLLLHPDAAEKLTGMLTGNKGVKLGEFGLSESEAGIVKLIAEGYVNKEIAEKLYLSEGTVKNKITVILEKLGLRDRTQIAIFYLKGGKK